MSKFLWDFIVYKQKVWCFQFTKIIWYFILFCFCKKSFFSVCQQNREKTDARVFCGLFSLLLYFLLSTFFGSVYFNIFTSIAAAAKRKRPKGQNSNFAELPQFLPPPPKDIYFLFRHPFGLSASSKVDEIFLSASQPCSIFLAENYRKYYSRYTRV